MIPTFKDLPLMDRATLAGRINSETSGETTTWDGLISWRTELGASTIKWLFGRRHGVWNARTPTGDVVSYIEAATPGNENYWLLAKIGESGYVRGQITETDEGILFTPTQIRNYDPAIDATSDFERALASDEIFRRLVLQDAIAYAAYDYIRNASFRRDSSDSGRWSCSSRYAGGLVARIRDIGETYLDFYLGSQAFLAADTIQFEEALERVHWHALTPEEFAVDHNLALALLETVLGRAPDSIPLHQRPQILSLETARAPKEPADAIDEFWRAIRAGCVTAAEHAEFFMKVDMLNERRGAVINADGRTT